MLSQIQMQLLRKMYFLLIKKTKEDDNIVEFELVSLLELQNANVPNRTVYSNHCPWQYRGDIGCGYKGKPIADQKNVRFVPSGYNGSMVGADTYLSGDFNDKEFAPFNDDQSYEDWNVSSSYNKGDAVKVVPLDFDSSLNPISIYVCVGEDVKSNPIFDRENWKLDECDRTLCGCRLRFSDQATGAGGGMRISGECSKPRCFLDRIRRRLAVWRISLCVDRMTLSSFEKKIIQYAESQPHEEVCGFVLLGKDLTVSVLPMKNEHEQPDKCFSISPKKFIDYKINYTILGVYHSHPSTAEQPSEYDIKTSEELGIPYLIYSIKTKKFYLYCPESYDVETIIGRPYVKGFYECTSIFRDYFNLKLNKNISKYNNNYWLQKKM